MNDYRPLISQSIHLVSSPLINLYMPILKVLSIWVMTVTKSKLSIPSEIRYMLALPYPSVH